MLVLLQQIAATLHGRQYVLMMFCHDVNCCLPTEHASLVQTAACMLHLSACQAAFVQVAVVLELTHDSKCYHKILAV